MTPSNTRLTQIKLMLEEHPNDAFLNYAVALEHNKNNRHEEALLQLEKVLSIDMNYLAAYYQLGKVQELLMDYNSAKKTYENGIVIAKAQQEKKTQAELQEALDSIEEL